MKINRSHVSNGIFAIVLLLLLIPQTRKPILLGFNKVRAMFAPSVKYNADNAKLSEYSWSLLDKEGNTLKLSNMKGEVIFVNLWATWCAPCIAEMSAMDELYRDYKDKMKFLFISNEELYKVNAFLTSKGYDLSNFKPASPYPSQLSSKTIPATFIIGKNGVIHVTKKGPADWNSDNVRKLLDKLTVE